MSFDNDTGREEKIFPGEILPPDDEPLMHVFAEALSPLVQRYGFDGIEAIGLLITRLQRIDPRAARRLLENGPMVIRELMVYGPETVVKMFEWSLEFLPFGAFLPVLFLESSPDLLKKTDRQTLERIVLLFLKGGRTSPSLLPSLLKTSPMLLDLGGFPLLAETAECCFALAEISPTYALKTLERCPSLSSELIVAYGQGHALTVFRIGTLMARTDWNCALEWLERSLDLSRCYSRHDRMNFLRKLCQEVNSLIPFHPRLILTLLETVLQLEDFLGEVGQRSFLELIQEMAAQGPEKMIPFLHILPEKVRLLMRNFSPPQIEEIFRSAKSLCRRSADLIPPFFEALALREPGSSFEEVYEMQKIAEEASKTGFHFARAFLEVYPTLRKSTGFPEIRTLVASLIPLARISWEAAVKVMAQSPTLYPRLTKEGWEEFSGLLSALTRENGASVQWFLDRSAALLALWSDQGGIELIRKICLFGTRAAGKNPRLAMSLVLYCADWIRISGWAGWEKIAVLASDLGKTSRTTALALVESGPGFLEHLTFDDLERLCLIVGHLSQENHFAASSLLEKGADFLNRLKASGSGSNTTEVFFKIAEAVLQEWRLLSGFLDKGPILYSLLGRENFDRWLTLLGGISSKSGQTAVRFLEGTPKLYRQIGMSGVEGTASLIQALGGSEEQAALSAVEKIPGLLERLGGKGGPQTISAVFDMAAKVSRTSPAVALRLLEKSPEFLDWVGLEGLGLIAAHLQETAEKDEEKALAYLAVDSPSWIDLLESIPKGLDLQAVQTVLSHYLKALLGRRIEIVAAEEPYGDGIKIYLPRRVREFQNMDDNFLYYKVAATHEEAHLEFGSYEFDLACLDVVPTEKIPVTEKESDLERFFRIFPEPALARDLFNLLEDRRIEQRLAYEYPALGEAIWKMNKQQMAKRVSPWKITHPKQRAVEVIGSFLKLGCIYPETDPQTSAVLRRLMEKVAALDTPDADVYEAARLTYELYPKISGLSDEPYRQVKPLSRPLDQRTVIRNIGSFSKTSRRIRDRITGQGGKEEPSAERPPEAESGGVGNIRPTSDRPFQENSTRQSLRQGGTKRTFREPEGGGRSESGKAEKETEETYGMTPPFKFASPERMERLLRTLYREKGVTPKEVERRLEVMNLNELFLFLHHLEASFSQTTELLPEAGSFLYPEWGEDIGTYRFHWARVREQTLRGAGMDFYRRTVERYAHLLKKIRREFQALKPEGVYLQKRQYDGNDIDLEAAVEFWSDRKAGLSPPEKLYRQKRRRQRDIAVSLLVDMSRSTRGEVIEREKEALIMISEALEEVGDAFAIYGFSGDNRDNVDFYLIKTFEDPYDQRVKQRISAVSDHFENRDGAAIRHATERLRHRPERTRLLILLSDGKPVDKEYAGSYALEDTRMALKEAGRLGIKTFCITVDREAPEYLPRMYSHSRWAVLDRLELLPGKITRLYRNLTCG